MSWQQWFLAAVFAGIGLHNVAIMGRFRPRVDPDHAVGVLICCGVMIAVIVTM
jgi:hypothetical protein